jgi:hypothetical protein
VASTSNSELLRLAQLGKRAETRGKAAQGCVTALLTKVLSAFFGGWMLMLSVGIAHLNWLPQLPTIGYWVAVLLVALMKGVFSLSPPPKKEN